MLNIVEAKRSIFFSSIRICLVIAIIYLLSSVYSFAQDQQVPSLKIESEKSIQHNFYLGGKLGLIYVFGIELNYIIQSQEINRIYMAAAIQTSLVVNSANVGGGVFLGKTGIGIGCRYHHLLWFESESDSKIQPGYGPEVVWNRTIGTKYIINLHAGGIITEGSFFPDISFGVFLPLNK